MPKLRVYQLAKELQVQSALVLELLDRMGQEIRSDLSVLDPDVAELVRVRVTSAIATERKRLAEEHRLQDEQARRDRETAARTERVEESEAPAPPAEEAPPEPSIEEPVPVPPIPAPEPTPVEREQPIAAKPAVPKPAAPEPVAAKPAAATRPAAPTAPGAPGRKPRVFPARRLVPHPSIRTATKRVVAAKPPGGAARPASGAPGVPRPPVPPGARTMPPPFARPKRRKKERHAAPAPARPKPELPPVPKEITLSEAVTVKELAEKLNRKSKDVIAKLITRGVIANINQPLDPEMAIEVAQEFGSEAKIISFEEETQAAAAAVATEVAPGTPEAERVASAKAEPRPPVVTVMGHVDHGKTSLLDAIRVSDVATGEAGGITQHIGAYQVEVTGRKITFLDTPGHEAFTLMRSRGSKVTDIVVLVVAAEDGVKPQTIEAIDHARVAQVPMVVAINKIDKPNAAPDRVKQQLAEQEVVVEEYGGDTVSCEISAKKRIGIEELLEMILLVADMKDLRADPERPGTGVVLETKLDRSRGIVSTVLIQDGTMHVGDPFIAGAVSGKVRAMVDETGQRVQEAGPSVPVELTGFTAEPHPGDAFQTVADEVRARQIASFRLEKARAESQLRTARRTLESLSREVAAGEVKELGIILKADFQGSAEAIQKSLGDLPSDKIRVRVIRSSIGAISRADILLASASDAIVVGFNVRPDRATAELAKQEGVEVRLYTVIYDLINDVKQAMLGMLEPILKEAVLGQAEVRQLFKVPKIGMVAGCLVTDGKAVRNAEVRLLRDHVVILTGKVGSLRRFKDDVAEVTHGTECGIGIANYNDVKVGDVIEFFVTERIAAQTL
jgi:translation initiation factor IF-2